MYHQHHSTNQQQQQQQQQPQQNQNNNATNSTTTNVAHQNNNQIKHSSHPAVTPNQAPLPYHPQLRNHVIMSPEDAASGRKPDPWFGVEIVGSVRNLSPSLWNMTHLTALFLNDNCLSKLPADIGRLTNLRRLDLSTNKLRALPREIGELILLEELLLNDNQLRTLPYEMGRLFHLKRLGLKGNVMPDNILQIHQEPKGTQKLVTYLLEHLGVQAPRPPQRPWVLIDQPCDRSKPSCMFTTMCYNVLCDKYATRQLYGYCPQWALNWDYRKHSILEELKAYSADIIALQEVETEQYHDYFLHELQQEGYEGIFSPKSRAKTMPESERKHVDGCAIFYKTSKFSLVTEHLIEFCQLAMANAEGSNDMLNRVMTKDNIALVALLQIKDGAFDSFPGGCSTSGSNSAGLGSGSLGATTATVTGSVGGSPSAGAVGSGTPGNSSLSFGTQPIHQQRLLVCTAHIHWDPEFCDVKLIQTIMLTHELQAIANQAAKDLLASSGENINTLKQYYFKPNGTNDSSVNLQNHVIGGGRQSTLNASTNDLDNDHDDNISGEGGGTGGGDDDSRLDHLGQDIIPIILCGDFNSLPESSVVEFLSNGRISADHQDFKELAYRNCLRRICNSRSSALANSQHSQTNQSNQYSGQSKSSTVSATTTNSSPNDEQHSKASPNDSLTNTFNGNGNQRPTNKNGAANYNSTTNNSESNVYTHPFQIASAYAGEGSMPYTNYTFDFRGVIDYIFYSKNLMQVLGVSGLEKQWLVDNRIPGLPHPYFPSDHFPLYVELEILPSPRIAPQNRYKELQHHPQQLSQFSHSQHPQHNRKNEFFQNPMRKPFFGT